MPKFYKGAIILLLSAFGFGLPPIFALFAYKANINVSTLLFLRFSFGALLFFVYGFARNEKFRVNKKDLIALIIFGGIGYNLQSRLYFSAVKYIPSSLAALFLYTYPMIVTALSFFIDHEKVTWKTGICIALSFSGLVMILGTSVGKINGVGTLMALGAAFVYSGYIIIGNRVLKKTPPLVTSAFISLFSAIGVLTAGILAEGVNFHFQTIAWFPIIGLVLFSTVIAMLFFFRGMELLGPTKASIISMTEPVFTIILSTIILHDRLTTLQLTGGAIVLAGSLLIIWSRENERTGNELTERC
jgi:drug/metabolite transporter (DMT)-like permease